jgi:hypothetical protein
MILTKNGLGYILGDFVTLALKLWHTGGQCYDHYLGCFSSNSSKIFAKRLAPL